MVSGKRPDTADRSGFNLINIIPESKLGITEYHFGGDDDASGAIAQAEALGCYADHGVYFASLWGGSGYTLSALNLYTNYDGKGGSFGDMLIPTITDDVSLSSAYAASDAGDETKVTVMITNKNMTASENASVAFKMLKKIINQRQFMLYMEILMKSDLLML